MEELGLSLVAKWKFARSQRVVDSDGPLSVIMSAHEVVMYSCAKVVNERCSLVLLCQIFGVELHPRFDPSRVGLAASPAICCRSEKHCLRLASPTHCKSLGWIEKRRGLFRNIGVQIDHVRFISLSAELNGSGRLKPPHGFLA